MEAHMDRLAVLCANPAVEAAFNEAVANVQKINSFGDENEWQYATIEDFQQYFRIWFTDLEQPTGGLGLILPFTWFYLNNTNAYRFLNTFQSRTGNATEYSREIFDWTVEFIMIRGEFMDSKDSTKYVDEWMKDPSTQIGDFIVPEGGFTSFNQFFARELDYSKNPRPVDHPDDDSLVCATADTIINFILADLTLHQKMDIKGRQISVYDMLNKSKLAKYFVGGTAVSCVLMPNVYHHYHSPVNGKIVESGDIPGIYNGIMDGEHWFNDGDNIGEGDTDFSIFEDFHRAYFIIETEGYGHVAMVPVGLNTISRIKPSVINNKSSYVSPGDPPVPVRKGDELGYFQYGGSLNIVMFEKDVFGCVSVLMGNRIGQMMKKEGVASKGGKHGKLGRLGHS